MKLNPENKWVLLWQEIERSEIRAKARKEETPRVYKTSNVEPAYVQVTNFYLQLQKTSEVLNHPGRSVILVNILVLLGPWDILGDSYEFLSLVLIVIKLGYQSPHRIV